MDFEKFFKKECICNKRILTICGYKFEYDRNDIRRSKKAFSAKVKGAKLLGANKISAGAIVEADKQSSLIVGKGSDIGVNTIIKAIKGGKITIGENCRIGENNKFVTNSEIELGDNVLMASGIKIIAGNHGYQDVVVPIMYQPCTKSQIKIGDETWVGENVLILSGVNIGKHCVIGGGSVVVKDIPDYSVAVGNPCKVVKKYNFETGIWEKV